MTAGAFAQEPDARSAGSKQGVVLSPQQVEGWLDSARRRGLLEDYGIDLPGSAVQPPLWGLSQLGRARLAEAVASTHFVPASVGKVVLPLLENAGKGVLGVVSIYLAARAARLVHHGVSVGFAQTAVGALLGIGLVAYLVIRYTDNRRALREALAIIEAEAKGSPSTSAIGADVRTPPTGRPTDGS